MSQDLNYLSHMGTTVIKRRSDATDYCSDVDTDHLASNCSVDKDGEIKTVAETQNSRMRLALAVLVRILLPLIDSMAKGLRGLRGINILKSVRKYRTNRGMLTNLFAFAANSVSMSLSSVQVVHRIDPWLKMIKLKRSTSVPVGMKAIAPTAANQLARQMSLNSTKMLLPMPMLFEDIPEKSVTLNVLYEPAPSIPIRADVVLIHGLHGSLVNTWKQGMWNSEGRRVKFERPPRPPVRPPKRPRHSRRLDAPHQVKRPRRYTQTLQNDLDLPPERSEIENLLLDACLEARNLMYSSRSREAYYCDEPETTEMIDGLEFSFPTFRSMTSNDDYSMDWEEMPKNREKRKKFIKTADYSACWPKDWLSEKFPDIRVIALNYTTDPYLWRPVWIKKRNRTSLSERSREMTDLLIEKGVGVDHPIVWVGHSKGGIFIKQIIVDAWESGRQSAEPLWRSSRGTFFYSVPHRGSPLADFNLPLLRQSIELLEIGKNCASILELHRRFVALYHKGHLKIRVFSFVETALTLMSVLYLRIVGVDSADPGIGEVCGVHLDHREICKPRSKDCMLYTELVKMIEKVS